MSFRLSNLALLNWGGYCGYVPNIDFNIDAVDENRSVVCIHGENGAGKTTLTDAYLTLLSPVNVTYNAASNRGDLSRDRRSTYSYIRGSLGKDSNAEDELKYLRPQSIVVSAICGSFVSTDGDVLHAAVIMQVGLNASDKISRTYIISENSLDLSLLRGVASKQINPKVLKKVYPDALYYLEHASQYMDKLGVRIGLGSDIDSVKKSIRLLSMIQGEEIPSDINLLFKKFVFEDTHIVPRTKEVIDAINVSNSGQSELDRIYREMTVLQKLQSPYEDVLKGLSEQNRLKGLFAGDVSPYQIWVNNKSEEWLRSSKISLEADVKIAEASVETAQEAYDKAFAQYLDMRDAQSGKKSDEMTELEQKISSVSYDLSEAKSDVNQYLYNHNQVVSEVDKCEQDIASLDDRMAYLDKAIAEREAKLSENMAFCKGIVSCDAPTNETEWNSVISDLLRIDKKSYDMLVAQADAVRDEISDTKHIMSDVEDRINHLSRTGKNIVGKIADARDMLADACGLTAADLPFVAELIDMKSSEEKWRLATHIALGSVLKTVLVDQDIFNDVRRAGDAIASRMGIGLNYQKVDLYSDPYTSFMSGGVCEKLEFDETSDFAFAVREVVGKRDALCVENLSDLDGGGSRVSLSGMMSFGNRGRIGYNVRDTHLIGFNNEQALSDAQSELEDYQEDLRSLDRQRADISRKLKVFDDRVQLGKNFSKFFDWSRDFDVSKFVEERDEIHKKYDVLSQRKASLEYDLKIASEELESAQEYVKSIVAEQDELKAQLEQLQSVALDAVQSGKLDELKQDSDLKHSELLTAQFKVDSLKEQIANIVHWLDELSDYSCKQISSDDVTYLDSLLQTSANTWAGYSKALADVEALVQRDLSVVTDKLTANVALYESYESQLDSIDGLNSSRADALVGLEREQYRSEIAERGYDVDTFYITDEFGVTHMTESCVLATWECCYQHRFDVLKSEYGELGDDNVHLQNVVNDMCCQVSTLYSNIRSDYRYLSHRVGDINDILKDIYLDDKRKRFIEVHARRVSSARWNTFKVVFDELSAVFTQHKVVDMSRAELDEVRAKVMQLVADLELEVQKTNPVIDQRNAVRIVIVEHDGDRVRTHDNTGVLSGGEVQQMSTCIVGSALLYVMGADAHNGPSYTTLFMDEAFSKSDHKRGPATLSALLRMGFNPVLSMPSDKIMQVSKYLGLVWFISKGSQYGVSCLSRSGLADCKEKYKEL